MVGRMVARMADQKEHCWVGLMVAQLVAVMAGRKVSLWAVKMVER